MKEVLFRFLLLPYLILALGASHLAAQSDAMTTSDLLTTDHPTSLLSSPTTADGFFVGDGTTSGTKKQNTPLEIPVIEKEEENEKQTETNSLATAVCFVLVLGYYFPHRKELIIPTRFYPVFPLNKSYIFFQVFRI